MPRALLVEDHDDVRRVMVLILEELGYEVRAEPDGDRGMAALRDGELDLLVTDLRLPGPNGLDIARAAVSERPGLPVLVVSGNVGVADERAIEALGIGLLRKPFTASELGGMIEALHAPGRAAVSAAAPRGGAGR